MDKLMDEVRGLLTPQQAAEYLQVKLSTIYNWTMRRILPTCKLGKLNRYRRCDLDAFISKNTTEVRGQAPRADERYPNLQNP